MLQRENLDSLRSSFLAEAVVTILAICKPHTLGAAYVPIPKDPATDWDALVAFYQTMNCDNWMTVALIGKWNGIFWDIEDTSASPRSLREVP